MKVSKGLYRHFKGEYYFVLLVCNDCTDGVPKCCYVNALNPDREWVRDLGDFTATVEKDGRLIAERPDNVTGQLHRFERVEKL